MQTAKPTQRCEQPPLFFFLTHTPIQITLRHPARRRANISGRPKTTTLRGGLHKKRSFRQRRLVIGIYPLQKGSFPAILRQKAAAGVSLAAASFLVLRRKPLFLKCFAVLPCTFFPAANSENAAMLGALQGRGGSCGEKDAGKTESIPMTNRLSGAFLSM